MSSKTIVNGYYGVQNVSIQCMIVQEVLHALKIIGKQNWRCVLANRTLSHPVLMDDLSDAVVLCPWHLKYSDYQYLSSEVHSTISQFLRGPYFNDVAGVDLELHFLDSVMISNMQDDMV